MVTRYQNIDRESGIEGPMSKDVEGEWVDWEDYNHVIYLLRKWKEAAEQGHALPLIVGIDHILFLMGEHETTPGSSENNGQEQK